MAGDTKVRERERQKTPTGELNSANGISLGKEAEKSRPHQPEGHFQEGESLTEPLGVSQGGSDRTGDLRSLLHSSVLKMLVKC